MDFIDVIGLFFIKQTRLRLIAVQCNVCILSFACYIMAVFYHLAFVYISNSWRCVARLKRQQISFKSKIVPLGMENLNQPFNIFRTLRLLKDQHIGT